MLPWQVGKENACFKKITRLFSKTIYASGRKISVKTEVIQCTSRFVRKPALYQFSFGNTIIELSDKVRDLSYVPLLEAVWPNG